MNLRKILRLEAPIPAKWTVVFALGLPAFFLFAGLGRNGLWDPYELTVADFARRIALNVFGGHGLALAAADNGMPTLGDLGRGELPFDSVALGFRIFGLHAWAGRLPLALWGLSGIAALYFMLRRLIDARAGLYGALILATMPLYFIQAKTILGDIVTMAGVTIAFAGFSVGTFASPSPRDRVGALVLGAVGLAAGFESRGLLIGVALPTLSVGASWAVSRTADRRADWDARDLVTDGVGAALLAIGALTAALGVHAFSNATQGAYSTLVGAHIAPQAKYPTFDFVILYLGHALFPWSAFIPLAVGRLFHEPPLGATNAAASGATAAGITTPAGSAATGSESDERSTWLARRRESHGRLVLLLGSTFTFGVYAYMAPRVGHLAFGGPALLAGIAAVALRDFERGAPPSRAMGIGVAILCALFLRDFDMFPDKGLSAFAVGRVAFPETFKPTASSLVLVSTIVFVVLVFFSWLERGEARAFVLGEYLAWPRALRRAFGGYLAYGLVALEAVLAVVGAVVFVGFRFLHAPAFARMGVIVRYPLINAYWAFPLLLFVPIFGLMAMRDLFRVLFRGTGLSRAFGTIAGGVTVGVLMCFVYYPALAAQLSPKEVFDSYAKIHRTGEPLGLLGVEARAAAYESGGEVKTFSDPTTAFRWLTDAPGRRWLALRNEDLIKLNSMYRGLPTHPGNLPVLDARSSQILLASNQMAPGETSKNPVASIVLDKEPTVQHRLNVTLQDNLTCLGWEIRDASDTRLVESVDPGRRYHFRIFYRVGAKVGGDWETFIHIDGQHRRFNGDHKTLEGKYPFYLWQPGDYIVDDHQFSLEPNFTSGTYQVFFGLYVGETRFKVISGPNEDNRIVAGVLEVH